MIKNSVKLSHLIWLTLAMPSKEINCAASGKNQGTYACANLIGYEFTAPVFEKVLIASNLSKTTTKPFENTPIQLPENVIDNIQSFNEIKDFEQNGAQIEFIIPAGIVPNIPVDIKVNQYIKSLNPAYSEIYYDLRNRAILKFHFNKEEKLITISLFGLISKDKPMESLETLLRLNPTFLQGDAGFANGDIIQNALKTDINKAFTLLYEQNNTNNRNSLIYKTKEIINKNNLREKLNPENQTLFDELPDKK